MDTAVANTVLSPAQESEASGLTESPLHFLPVTQEAMDGIMPFFEKENGRTTDFSYGGLLMWVDYVKYECCIYRDTLFIKGLVEDNTSLPAFSLPIGALPFSEAVGLIAGYCRENGIEMVFSAIPEYAVEAFRLLNPKKISLLEYWGDYMYPIEALASLKGKKLGKKRNHINKFIAENPDAEVKALTSENASKAMRFMETYDAEADGAPMEMIESCLTRKMINYVAQGDRHLEGIILESGGRTVGFSIGDIKGDTLYVHIEKATRNTNGSYEAVNKAFASRMLELHPELVYVNREDDGGDEGLRQAKRSYHPIEVLKKYNIVF